MTNLKILMLILASITLSSTAQLMLKSGMSSAQIQNALTNNNKIGVFWLIAINFRIIIGIVLFILSVSIWLFVLAKVDLSYAYPFVGLGFILTMVLGRVFLNEFINVYRLVGTFLIALGVYLVSLS